MKNDTDHSPRLKGLFLLSQVNHVKNLKGAAGVAELEKLYGANLAFKAFQKYSTRDEERLIKCALKVVSGDNLVENEDVAAGRFHMESFLDTPYAQVALKLTGGNYRGLFKNLAKTLFSANFDNVSYDYEEKGDREGVITLKNSGYAPRHFEGFIQRLTEAMGKKCLVETKVISPNEVCYHLTWIV